MEKAGRLQEPCSSEGLVSILVYVLDSLCGVGGGPILGALAQQVSSP